MSESAIFTAIPVGLSPDHRQLRVTVFITPRLVPKEPREPLRSGNFPAFERWPEVLGKDDFVLGFDGGTRLRAVRDPASPVPHAKLWDVLFGETMVGDGSFQDHAEDLVVSYPADAAARILEALYRDVAHQAGSGFPGIRKEPLLSLRAEAAEARKIYAGLRNPTRPQTHVEKEVPPGPAQYLRKFPGGHRFLNFDDPRGILAANYPARGIPLAAVSNFYDRRIARAYPVPVDPDTGKPVEPEPATEPDLEFHGFVSFCTDYPALLRYLGLAIDLLADIPDGPAAFAREVANTAWSVSSRARHHLSLKRC